MEVKNNTIANLSVFAKSTRGAADKKSLVVPGEATIQLDDKEWVEEYAEQAAKLIAAGNLEITVDVVKSEEEIEEEKELALEAARKLIEESEGEGKSEVKPVGKPKAKTAAPAVKA